MSNRKILPLLAGLILGLFTLRKGKADSATMCRLDFSSSTRRMGIRFSEKLRTAWRRRWLRVGGTKKQP